MSANGSPPPLEPALSPAEAVERFDTIVSGPPIEPGTAEAELAPESETYVRYEKKAMLGEGGMGEVHLCRDRRIGREVAMKVVRAESTRNDLQRRFLREARVQGQLEHPAIVPVYDLGRDDDGAAFFTMKRVRGLTFEHVLDALVAKDPAALAKYTRHKLLTAFGSACLAIDFAHARGVIHRDLKPANVMVGDFGEVYVLDWGLAKLAGEPDPEVKERIKVEATGELRVGMTDSNTFMGTPGYMSPEQILGEPQDALTDVYSLGTILFELLTLEAAHGAASSSNALYATIAGINGSPRARFPELDIPPELDAICLRATARNPKERFPTARALHEAIERFLAGDRDIERRKVLAREHSQAAAMAAARALVRGVPFATALEQRSSAMREVSRALALDPDNVDAMRTLSRLFMEVPAVIPDQALQTLARAHEKTQRKGAQMAAIAYFSWIVYAPLVILIGTKHAWWGVACDLFFLAAGIASWISSRAEPRRARIGQDLGMVFAACGTALASGLFGPLMFVPVVAAMTCVLYVVSVERSRRAVAIILACSALAIPVALERFGIGPIYHRLVGGALVVEPHIMSFEQPTLAFLLLANLAVIITGAIFVGRFRDSVVHQERKMAFQTWLLRQLVPGDVAPTSIPDTAR